MYESMQCAQSIPGIALVRSTFPESHDLYNPLAAIDAKDVELNAKVKT